MGARFKDDEMSKKYTELCISKELYYCVSECSGSGRKVCRFFPREMRHLCYKFGKGCSEGGVESWNDLGFSHKVIGNCEIGGVIEMERESVIVCGSWFV